jgi:two-component system OmpR family response regulator
MAQILVIEDDPTTAGEIVAQLAKHGHDVHAVGDGLAGLEKAEQGQFDVITLDRMLPSLDGLTLVERLRDKGVATPVLMISALSDVDERIAGLRAGGDDYLTKPFSAGEMAVRVEVLLRRRAGGTDTMLNVGSLSIDLMRRQVSIDGDPIKLFQMEYRLLEFLARHPGEIVTRRVIFEKVWGYYFDPGANLINVYIARLRKKIDRPGKPSFISTIKGEGYRFEIV